MVRTGVIEAVEEKETNVGASKSISNAARSARMANLKKGGRMKRKKSSSLGIVKSQKFVVAVAEPAPAPSISFEKPSNDNLTLAEIEGHNDRARRPPHWREMINSRNTKK